MMKLSDVQLSILKLLKDCRYASTRQLADLYFANSHSPRTATRRANLATKTLFETGYITHLKRRIGGRRSGSGSYVWSITKTGLKHLRLNDPQIQVRFRNRYEPTAHHLEHTLGITQVYVELKKLERLGKIELEAFSFEPASHRSFAKFTQNVILKPDAYTKLVVGNEEEFIFFLELDKDTESLNRIVNQCKKYIQYFNTGIEQRETGIFPQVVWVVPDRKRQTAIENRIQEEINSYWTLFEVINLEEFPDFVIGDSDE